MENAINEMFGLFSERAASVHGSTFYRNADGQEVEVTCVGVPASKYHWPDVVERGVLVEWLREGRPDTSGLYVAG